MDKRPTEVEIKEFWERCGLTWSKNDYAWYDASHHYANPVLDLNNLFKYAVPKLASTQRYWKTILCRWAEGVTTDYQLDTLTLFWIILEVIHNG